MNPGLDSGIVFPGSLNALVVSVSILHGRVLALIVMTLVITLELVFLFEIGEQIFVERQSCFALLRKSLDRIELSQLFGG